MNADRIQIRKISTSDAAPCGDILFRAFNTIAQAHGFPPDFPDAGRIPKLIQALIEHPRFYGIVAEQDGRILGSNFVDERGMIAGIGPITVDPAAQNRSVGKQLMQHALARVKEQNFAGVRLVQAAYHNRSLSLYTKLGLVVREPLATMQGKPPARRINGNVRAISSGDVDACDRLCMLVHGHARRGELLDAVTRDTGIVVERDGTISGYTTGLSFFGHSVGASNDDLKDLIASTPLFAGPGFLLPTRNADLFRWCLENGLRVTQPMTLMTMGLYNEPQGPFLPSILY